MSIIKTADGWRQLRPHCVNEVWELRSWDDNAKAYVPDRVNGHLIKVGETDMLPSSKQEAINAGWKY